MKFKPGESGNPTGRPKGSRNIQTQLIKLLEPHAEQLINKMVEKALEGEPNALKLCIERLLPKAKHKAIESDLPILEEDNYMETIESILQEMLQGNIASDEGKKIIELIEEHQNRKRFDSLIHIP
ncbi:DUF5681 domain-containing protein [Legionella pneumophila serogroup 1]|jgi:hypothetical protein